MSGVTRLKQLLSVTKSIPLPDLCQGGTLSIRSSCRSTPLNVRLIPQWRDDGHLKLEQTLPPLSGGDDGTSRSSTVYSDTTEEMDLHITRKDVAGTLGNRSISVVVDYNRHTNFNPSSSPSSVTSVTPFPSYGLTNKHQEHQEHHDTNKVVTDDGTFHSNPDAVHHLLNETSRTVPYHDGVTHCTDHAPHSLHGRPPPSLTLTAKLPEKCNVTCVLEHKGGDITVQGKLEGEHGFHFSTTNGNVTLDKLRGDTVSLTTGSNGTVFVKRSLEARNLDVHVGNGGRFRAKMVNVSDANIQVQDDGVTTQTHTSLDEDDALALIDIGSIYASRAGDGVYLSVVPLPPKPIGDDGDNGVTASSGVGVGLGAGAEGRNGDYPKKVRVKSNHGHVSVQTVTFPVVPKSNADVRDETVSHGRTHPLVELGGVNGSFDVAIQTIHQSLDGSDDCDPYQSSSTITKISTTTTTNNNTTTNTNTNNNNNNNKNTNSAPAANVHIASLSPGQISSLTTDNTGDIALTFDRKVQSDVRLLSSPLVSRLDPSDLIDDDRDRIRSVLLAHDADVGEPGSANDERRDDDGANNGGVSTSPSLSRASQIAIQTDAFIEEDRFETKNLCYIEGRTENKSQEPDSRFERKNNPAATTSSVGKIRIEGAAEQALWGHGGGKRENNTGSNNKDKDETDTNGNGTDRPLVVAVTDGSIGVETLSWFGAIARRYGIKEEAKDLGRQARVKPAQKTS